MINVVIVLMGGFIIFWIGLICGYVLRCVHEYKEKGYLFKTKEEG